MEARKGELNARKPAVKACPLDRDTLTRFTIFGTDVEQCPTCRGFWFDRGELDRVKGNLDKDLRWRDIDLHAYAGQSRFEPTDLPCADCGSALCDLRFGTAAQLAFCPRCGGVWLDRASLKPFLDYLRTESALEPMDDVERNVLHRFVEIFTGRKGPLEEVKDFSAAWRLLSLRFMVDHPELAARVETARRALPF